MSYFKFVVAFIFFGFSAALSNVPFEVMYNFSNERPGNIAVSSKGDMYVTIHPVNDSHLKVSKITPKGHKEDFMIPMFLAPQEKTNIGLSNAIGIYIDKKDHLWVLDMGGEFSSPKFIVWNLKHNALERLIVIPTDVIKSNSFLQDFALDEEKDFAYIADMTMESETTKASPAIIAINTKTGEAKRLLDDSRFVKSAEPLMAEGAVVMRNQMAVGKSINPITIDAKNEWVYFGTMSAGEIHRIRTSDLRNFSLSELELEARINSMGYKPHSDGFKIDKNQNIYVGDVNNLEIGISKNKDYKTYIKSNELLWVDGLFVAKDGYVYAVVNQLNRHADFSPTKTDTGVKPFKIIRFKQDN